MQVTLVEIEASLLAGSPFANVADKVHVGALDPLLVQMALQAESFSAGGAIYAETMAQAFAQTLGRSLVPPDAPPLDDARMRRVTDSVRADPGADHTVTAMADLAAMSADHFARAFKTATGKSPLQYVIGVRIEAAQVLLRTTNLPVSETAFRVGYDDTSRFARHFRARVGATPGAWRAS
ncbi:MAG: AraC family transcriptional regulator [Pseudomonadota bacterium]